MKGWVVGLWVLLGAGCARQVEVAPGPADARQFIAAGNLLAADSALTSCSRAHPTDARGAGCRYWLVFVRLDPAHPGPPAGARAAAADFLARDLAAPGRDEITLLMRVAADRELLLARLDSSERSLLATRTPAATTEVRDDAHARDELDRLKAELARTQDELTRIKRRLSAPRP